MSESGFSGLPPGPRIPDLALPPGIAELRAKIIALRGEIRVLKARERMEGEIVRNNLDGTTVIRTPKGEITVELRGRDVPPPGTKVVVDLPAGDPPRQVTIAPLPAQTEAPPPATAVPAPPAPSASPRPPETQAAPPPSAPAVRIDIKTAEDIVRQVAEVAAAAATAVAQATLRPDDLIRLLPLPPQGQEKIIRAVAAAPLETQITSLPAQAQTQLANDLFERPVPQLTFRAVETALLIADLPSLPPLYTLASALPYAGFSFDDRAAPSFAAGAQFARFVLFASFAPVTAEDPSLPMIMPGTASPAISATFFETPVTAYPALPAGAAAPFTAFSGGNTLSGDQAFDARVHVISPPAVALTTPGAAALTMTMAGSLPESRAGAMTGTVAGMTPQNVPVLAFFTADAQTPAYFMLQFQADNLPAGTQIHLTPLAGAAAAASPAALSATAPFVPQSFFSDFSWPAMEDLSRALQQVAPQAGQTLSNLAINAGTPARIPAAALFFIAAIRSGDIGNWLGERTVDALRRAGKGDAITRLGRDAAGLQRSAAEPAGEWRAAALPFMADGQIQKMMLFYRHDRGRDDDEQGERKGTRFIFDLSLTKLGAVQLDGLHRPQQGKNGKLDLIVRTAAMLSGAMQQDMRRSYVAALEQAGLSGELSFQNKTTQFVKVMESL